MILIRDTHEQETQIQAILSKAAFKIQEEALSNSDLLKLSGSAFERIVCTTLNIVSINTDFYNRFEQTTAHAFPDIYAKILENKWFGVEVKTSQGDWKCFGNSIFESTKLQNLEDRIYVFFGKFSPATLECKWGKYESCIDNINITHSPRYQINMDIKDNPSLSVFTKMNTTYSVFSTSNSSERMDYVRKFKREGLGQNVALWWLPDHEGPSQEDEQKLVVKLYSELSTNQKDDIRYAAMAIFPEIFSKNNKKYIRLLPWLASQHGVVMGNIRDMFTSGGQKTIVYKDQKYLLPRIFKYIEDGQEKIKNTIVSSSQDELTNGWQLQDGVVLNEVESRIKYWISVASSNLQDNIADVNKFPTIDWLTFLFKQ